MKQTATNEWKDGINLDLHPIVTPNTVLTDNINGTFITYNGNEFCLQNDRGNEYVTSLSEGYIPIGIKEHNGILYIVSVNGDTTEIGTYPSPNYLETNYEESLDLVYKDFEYEGKRYSAYQPLRVLKNKQSFRVNEYGYTTKTPITIEVQDSYDGSVNLILVADQVKTRIINSGFSVLPNNKYKLVNRNQRVETNIYNNVDKETELIRTSDVLTNIDLLGVQSGGQFKGGNYTFYIKFGDADYNQTDVVAESGIVSIFNGNDGVPSTISGTLADERTDKMVQLRIIGLNLIYSSIYIYYSREYSDTMGYRMTEYGMFSEPIDLGSDGTIDEQHYQDIWLTGFEQTTTINSEELNVDYHTIDWARAEAQHSNMLLLANVGQSETFTLYKSLEDLSKSVTIDVSQEGRLDPVSIEYKSGQEYYSTQNIYNKVGYYPGEIYRFGIVYILKDGSKTPVFNVRGWDFQNDTELKDGVVLMPKVDVITSEGIEPIHLTFTVPEIKEPDVKGWFIVRQKRIPNTICEGLSIATDAISNTPMMWDGEKWVTQSFLSSDRQAIGEIVQLEYNAGQTDIKLDDPEESFDAWRSKKKYEYLSGYWLDLNDQGDMYLLPDDYVSDPEKSKSGWIEDAVRAIVNSNDFGLPEGAKVKIVTNSKGQFDDQTNDDEKEWDAQLADLGLDDKGERIEGRTSVATLHWFRKYTLSNDWEHTPEDIETNNYAVTIIRGTMSDIDGEPISNGNIISYNMWISEYERQSINSTLTKKFIQNKAKFGKESNSLLSLDPCVVPQVASRLDGSKFSINYERSLMVNSKDSSQKYKSVFSTSIDPTKKQIDSINEKCIFVPSNTAVKVVDDYEFSNVAGDVADVSKYKAFTTPFFVGDDQGTTPLVGSIVAWNGIFKTLNDDLYNDSNNSNTEEKRKLLGGWSSLIYGSNKNINLLRGLFTPYIGITNNSEIPFGIYSIKNKEVLDTNDFLVRQQCSSEYYCISEYTDDHTIDVYRGDCFTNTVTMRMIRNFIDPTAPISEMILDPDAWYKYVTNRRKDATDEDKKVSYKDVNVSDVNTVDLGYWVTFKCLSSYNLGLRSVDNLHVDEMALLGSSRSFYPLNGASTTTGSKIEESYLLNDGLSATVGRKRYNLIPNVPYSKSEFSNRIMFSNVNVTDAFTNGYRTFQGLSYKDYDKQYGAITKLISLGQNMFIVMEHGLGLVPVNPKALMQTTTGEAIHIYGYGVLPDEMTIISQDYGSKYEHSVIRTPIGIYGIDVDAKKIWRFSDKQGFETISDMKIETYLKAYLKSNPIEMGVSDIRTHYNGKKGDLMFTWYPLVGDSKTFSICYNERQNLWITKYDWYPIVSENINDEFYSLNENAIWDHSDFSIHNGHVSSWYNNDKGFEFEFVVSDPIGVNKIFDNLQIISNNVQPQEMEITIIGDDYMFNRKDITANAVEEIRKEYDNNSQSTSDIHGDKSSNPSHSPYGYYHFDRRLNQSSLIKWQPFKDIYEFGRRIGNIQYKNGMWFAQMEPIIDPTFNKEVRIRDKWAKIRIRYSGKDLAIITAIRTLINV